MFLRILLLSCTAFAWAESLTATCVSVADGDTLTIMVDGQRERVRLLGIDAPESQQEFGPDAGDYLAQRVLNRKVRIEYDERDQYDRLLGTVYLGGENINLTLIKKGYAQVYMPSYAPVTPNPVYLKAQNNAKAAKVGLWANPNAVAPWEYRRNPNVRAEHHDPCAPAADNSEYWISNSGKTHNKSCDKFRGNGGTGHYSNLPSGVDAGCCGGAHER